MLTVALPGRRGASVVTGLLSTALSAIPFVVAAAVAAPAMLNAAQENAHQLELSAAATELHERTGARTAAFADRAAAAAAGDMVALAASVAVLDALLVSSMGIERAAVENELGLAKRLLGEGESDGAVLAQAAEHYRRAIGTFDAAGRNAESATVRWNLAVVLELLGETESDPKALAESAALLGGLPPAARPVARSNLYREIGLGQLEIGTRRNDVSLLREAVANLNRALEDASTDGRSREQWAETQNALATALETLGEREWSMERLEAALDARRNAQQLYQAAGLDSYRFYFDTRIAALEELIETRRGMPLSAAETGHPNVASGPA